MVLVCEHLLLKVVHFIASFIHNKALLLHCGEDLVLKHRLDSFHLKNYQLYNGRRVSTYLLKASIIVLADIVKFVDK